MTANDRPPELSASYWLPFTPNRAFLLKPRLVSSASGLWFRTPDGRDILDASSGLYCVNAGHGRRAIAEAIAAAAHTLDYAPAFQVAHPAVFDLTDRIAALAPGDLKHVFLATSGSEAVDTALKLALAYHAAAGGPDRQRFIGRDRGYHGVNIGGTSVGGIDNNRRAFAARLPGIDLLATTYHRERQAYSTGEPSWGGHLAGELEAIIALRGADTIAAVIVEPVAGSTGCLPPPKGYLQRLREITQQHGILLIFDEVITGFGRLGYAFAAERYGIVPDMICFAKGVSNGAAPLAGVLVRSPIREAILQGPEHLPELFHGYTYSGHPLGVAAARATLDIYRDEALFDRAKGLEAAFAEIMLSLRGAPRIADIRPIGLMCGIDLDPDPGRPGACGFAMLEHLFHARDLYVRFAMDTLIVAPPLITTVDDLTMIRDRISQGLTAMG